MIPRTRRPSKKRKYASTGFLRTNRPSPLLLLAGPRPVTTWRSVWTSSRRLHVTYAHPHLGRYARRNRHLLFSRRGDPIRAQSPSSPIRNQHPSVERGRRPLRTRSVGHFSCRERSYSECAVDVRGNETEARASRGYHPTTSTRQQRSTPTRQERGRESADGVNQAGRPSTAER